MRTKRAYRPNVVAALEDRAVPSAGLSGSLPAQDAAKVASEFNAFERVYNQSVLNILLAPGTTDAAAQRAQFDTAIGDALTQLNTRIATDVSNLPTGSQLATQIQSELLSPTTTTTTTTTTPTDLQSQLKAVSYPSSFSWSGVLSFAWQSYWTTERVEQTVVNQVRTAPAPTGQISDQALQQVFTSVNGAFQTFNTSYFGAIPTTLFASSGTPSANRQAFDANTATALTTLNNSVTSALSTLPEAVRSQVTASVLSSTTTTTTSTDNTLQTRLSNITTPNNSGFFASLIFRLRSAVEIGSFQARLNQQILSAVRQYNASQTGTGTNT